MAISLSNNKHTANRVRARLRRQARGRKRIHGTAERPRLVVTRSTRHMFVQIVDDSRSWFPPVMKIPDAPRMASATQPAQLLLGGDRVLSARLEGKELAP